MEGKKAIQFWGKIEKYCWHSRKISLTQDIHGGYRALATNIRFWAQGPFLTSNPLPLLSYQILRENWKILLTQPINISHVRYLWWLSCINHQYIQNIDANPKYWCNIGILAIGLVDTWFVDRWIMTLFVLSLYLMCQCPKYSHKSFWTQGSFLSSDLLPSYQILREKWKLLLTWPMNISYLRYPWWLSCFDCQYI